MSQLRLRHLLVWNAMGVVLAVSTTSSAQPSAVPVLEARWVNETTVRVVGRGFDPNATVMIDVDVDLGTDTARPRT